MEKIKIFWQSKTVVERRKIVVYTIAGLFLLMLSAIVISLNAKVEKEEVSKFSNPDAKEVAKFNSRAEANNLGKVDSASLDLAMNNMFGNESADTEKPFPKENTYVEPNYSNTHSGYTEPKYTQVSPARKDNYNNHNTYGDYSMWQADEPKDNSIGYTQIKSNPKSKNSIASQNTSLADIPEEYAVPNYSSSKEKATTDGEQIRAKLLTQGYAKSGRTLSFVLLDQTNIGGIKTGKGQIVTGVAEEENNRLKVNFSTIKINNKIVPAHLRLFGSDGMEGLPISGSETRQNNIDNAARNVANSQLSRIPVIGGIIGGAVGNRTPDNRIKLTSNIECIIINYEDK